MCYTTGAAAVRINDMLLLLLLIAEHSSTHKQISKLPYVCARTGRYRDAVGLYAKALAHCPDAVPVYINRSMTQLQLRQYRQAHEDASIALSLEPGSYKAYHKRYQAKRGLQDYQVNGLHGDHGVLKTACIGSLWRSCICTHAVSCAE